MVRTPLLQAALAAFLVLGGPSTAAALILEVSFQGTVTSVDAGLASQFTIGDAVSVLGSIDLSTADSDPGPTRGEYVGPTLTPQIGSYAITGVSPGASAFAVTNDMQDEFRISGVGLVAPDVGAFEPSVLGVVLGDSSGNAFSDTTLPTSLALGDFDSNVITLSFLESGTSAPALVQANVTAVSATVIPEPAPSVLLLAGILALSLLRRAR